MAYDPELYERIMDGVAAVLAALDLEGIGSNIYVRLQANPLQMSFPAVVVTPEGEQEEDGEPDFEDTGGVYPCRVVFCWRTGDLGEDSLHRWLRWRKAARDAFEGQDVLADVPEAYDTATRPGPIVQEKLPDYQYVLGWFTVLVTVTEERP